MLEGCLFFFQKPLRSQSFKISTIKISTNLNALRAKITKYMRKYMGKIFAVFFFSFAIEAVSSCGKKQNDFRKKSDSLLFP